MRKKLINPRSQALVKGPKAAKKETYRKNRKAAGLKVWVLGSQKTFTGKKQPL
jgi:hypothetical protein